MTVAPAIEVVPASDRVRWMAVLAEVEQYDVYHLPEYHAMAERAGEGQGRLFVYVDGAHIIALPLLIRSCDALGGLEGVESRDATSVYGYAGPLVSDTSPPVEVIAGFQTALQEALLAANVVTLFTRLHPLLAQTALISGAGETVPNGTTVSVDLTRSEAAQTAELRQNHVRDIRKLRGLGATCVHDATGSLDTFVDIYREAMDRLGAAPQYYFDDDYFRVLEALRGKYVHLFTCRLGDDVIAASLVFACQGIAQYHLGAVRTAHTSLGPLKLVLDTARMWASREGMRVFHLGGGLGAQEDALFRFKAGFSERRHTYSTWRWVLDGPRVDALTDARVRWNDAHGLTFDSTNHFPPYRRSASPVQPE